MISFISIKHFTTIYDISNVDFEAFERYLTMNLAHIIQ